MNVQDLKDYIVVPTLKRITKFIPFSDNAVDMVLGTGAQESNFNYLDQTTPGPGPAYGIYQMERATHDDHVQWLTWRSEFLALVRGFQIFQVDDCTEMAGNLYYATIMCRIHYFRKPGAIPSSVEGKAGYWKRWYNTELGKGTVEEFVKNYRKYVEPLK